MHSSLPTRWAFAAATLALIVLDPGMGRAQGTSGGQEVITNENVIQMIVGKVPKDLILTKVQTTKSEFDLSPEGLIKLALNKVPNDIVKTMILTTSTARGSAAPPALDNAAVIKLVTGQVSKDVITTLIQTSKAGYDLTTDGLIALNQNKVPQDVVKVMMAASAGTPTSKAAVKKPPQAGTKPSRAGT